MKKSTVFTTTVLAVSLLGAGFVGTVAANPHGRDGMEFSSRGGAHHDPIFAMGRHLDLTDSQRERIKEIFREQAAQHGEKMQVLNEIRKELQKQALSDSFDPGQVQTLSRRQADLMAELQVGRTTALNQAYQVLDEPQRQKLAQWQEKRQERIKNRKADGNGPRGAERG